MKYYTNINIFNCIRLHNKHYQFAFSILIFIALITILNIPFLSTFFPKYFLECLVRSSYLENISSIFSAGGILFWFAEKRKLSATLHATQPTPLDYIHGHPFILLPFTFYYMACSSFTKLPSLPFLSRFCSCLSSQEKLFFSFPS